MRARRPSGRDAAAWGGGVVVGCDAFFLACCAPRALIAHAQLMTTIAWLTHDARRTHEQRRCATSHTRAGSKTAARSLRARARCRGQSGRALQLLPLGGGHSAAWLASLSCNSQRHFSARALEAGVSRRLQVPPAAGRGAAGGPAAAPAPAGRRRRAAALQRRDADEERCCPCVAAAAARARPPPLRSALH
jgi:hypothetical protein